jgi:galactokinase
MSQVGRKSLNRQNAMALKRAVEVAEQFVSVFGTTPQVFRAPGRVNLIGEHTDYNDGFVMPAAIGFYTYVGVTENQSDLLRVYSRQFDESIELPLHDLVGPPRRHWSDYVRGVAAELRDAGCEIGGANLVIDGDVPLGAGLSSSAAIEMATALAFTALRGTNFPRIELVKLCQRAENQYSGTKCGIMDQFISCFGIANQAVMLDCRSLSATQVPLPSTVHLLICNTMVKHELAGGEYNDRRASCERSVAKLSQSIPNVQALRDISLEQLEQHRRLLDDVDYRRCRHVITENARVSEAARVLAHDDLSRFGELMCQSHESLDKDYEVTSEELNIMVELARQIDGVYGARMTGGGFGGCTINLVDATKSKKFKKLIACGYKAETGLEPEVYICSASDGASQVLLS